MSFVKCKVSTLVRVRFPIISREIATEACELLGAGICPRRQDTPCRQLALRKSGWGRSSQSTWEGRLRMGAMAVPGLQGPERSLAGTLGERGGWWTQDFRSADGRPWHGSREGSVIIQVLAPSQLPLSFLWTVPHPGVV